MQKGYTDGGPWHGNQVRMGPVLIRSYSESGHDIVIQVVHIRVRVGAEWRWSGSRRGQTEAECGRGLPRGADKGETEGKRARGKSYHDKKWIVERLSWEECPSIMRSRYWLDESSLATISV